jgi:hypothetical protein
MNLSQVDNQRRWRVVLIAALILFAVVMRIVPHPWNLTPLGAMALFSGAVIRKRALALVLPLLGLVAGDVFIGFHKLIPIVYGSFLISVAIGFWLRDNRTVLRLGGAVFLGALQLFMVTNFGVWAFMTGYSKTVAGLMACYTAGIPYFWNTLAGDALYSGLLFGALYLAERAYPAFRPNVRAAA